MKFFQFDSNDGEIHHNGGYRFNDNEYPDDFFAYINKDNKIMMNVGLMTIDGKSEGFKIISAESQVTIKSATKDLEFDDFYSIDTFKK